MLVFDFVLEMHPLAEPPDFSKEFKKPETIERKKSEWLDEGGWQKTPASCIAAEARVADPENLERDIRIPMTPNSVVQFVDDIVNPSLPVVTEALSDKMCILANTINHMITELHASGDEEHRPVIDELMGALSKLYAFRLEYIRNDYVHGNCHNPIKTLKWDALGGIVLRKMLGLGDQETRLAALHQLARRCGLK